MNFSTAFWKTMENRINSTFVVILKELEVLGVDPSIPMSPQDCEINFYEH